MGLLDDRIVASYRWACNYANTCAASFAHTFDHEELTRVGILGYVVAANRYDESKGSSFRSFCATRIRGAILDELRHSTWESRSSRRKHHLLSHARLTLEATLSRSPTQAELAQALGIEEKDLEQLQRLSRPASYISLDDEKVSYNDNCPLPLKEILPDERTLAPSEAVDSNELRRAICLSINKLPPAEATVVVLYYMRNMPFHEIAKHLQLTPSRISQLHHHALNSLRKLLNQEEAQDYLQHLD